MQKKTGLFASGVVLFATLIGGAIRIQAVLASPAPLNDGGLFYALSMDLVKNNFALPAVSSYNLAEIPFAYPPLAFYLTGILHALLGVSLFDLVRILPAVVSTLTIPAFYLMARELSRTRETAGYATLAFALLPRAFDWVIMGGGITRSFGLLFAILALWQAKRYFNQHLLKNLAGLIIFSILIVYAHPEAAVHTAIGGLLLYLFFDRSRKGFFSLLACAAVILASTAPWWGLVLARHGLAPFEAARAAAGQDSYNPLVGLIIFFRFSFSDEPFLSLFAVLGLVGFFGLLFDKKAFFPAWIFGAHLIEPRGGTLYMMLPLACSAGYALDQMLLPVLGMKLSDGALPKFKTQITAYSFLAFILLYGIFSADYVAEKVRSTSLTTGDLETFRWVDEQIPAGSRFAILTGTEPLRDSTSEWFPALNRQISVATVFGYEWLNDGNFARRVENYKSLQACRSQEAACLEAWSKTTGLEFDYVYLRKEAGLIAPLILFLNREANYQLLYETPGAAIFKRR